MPTWIILAIAGSIIVTGLLTWVLWSLNAPLRERAKRDGAGGDAGFVAAAGGGSRDRHDGTEDGGSGGDGGGDGGGGE